MGQNFRNIGESKSTQRFDSEIKAEKENHYHEISMKVDNHKVSDKTEKKLGKLCF